MLRRISIGGGTWFAWGLGDSGWAWGGSLVGLLVLISAIILTFTGTYPRALFDIILAIHRWALRVAGYTGLMTDRYPPFRLDLGGDEPSRAVATDAAGTPVSVRHAD